MSSPLHVLWLIDHVCYDGSLHGGGRLFHNLLPRFDPRELRVFPYFLRSSEEVQRLFGESGVAVESLGKAKYDPTALLTIWRLCRRHRIDVMHLFCYASSTFGRIVGRATGIPVVIHDFDTQVYFPYPFYLRLLDGLLAQGTERALAASPVTAAYMHDVRRVPRERIELMAHAIPDASFGAAGASRRREARAALGVGEGEVVFCTITKLGPDRGNELLLRSFARLVARHPEARLLFVYKPTHYHRVPKEYRKVEWIGDTGRMRQMLHELVTRLSLGDRVCFVESLDRPEPYYEASDALVLPYQHDRFSSVYLLEAFARDLPAVATDLGEQGELIREGGGGLLVPAGDEEALTAAMARLAEDPAERARLAREARSSAERHGTRAAAERLAALYGELARGAGAR